MSLKRLFSRSKILMETKGEVVKGYKAFDKDLKCRDNQFKVGDIYTHKGEFKLCETGFHFCLKPADVFNYYSFAPETRVCEIEALGDVAGEGDKRVTNKIKILREIPKLELFELVNQGKENTGLTNSGDSNSGHYNSGDYNSGLFNTNEPNMRLFNKQTKLRRKDPRIQAVIGIGPKFKEWINFENMKPEEKAAWPKAETCGGYLKDIPYKEAWLNFWVNSTAETRKKFTSLPFFDNKIFQEITGIDVKKKY